MSKPSKSSMIVVFDKLGITTHVINLVGWYRYWRDTGLRALNAKFKSSGAPDGLPLPPPRYVHLVSGHYNLKQYYESGELTASFIREALDKNGLSVESLGAILDFGCGCGRVLRQWKSLTGPKVYGSDYNPRLVDWCRKSFGFAEVRANGLGSGLGFKDEMFDFIYSISVFTHLDNRLQQYWMGELARVLKPGGHLLITVHGSVWLERLTDEEKHSFGSGLPVVRRANQSGSNACATFFPQRYVSDSLAAPHGFTVVDFIPGGSGHLVQDMYLLKKTGPDAKISKAQ